mmetsp:Transcript_11590/g.17724  ORF Transcript_11590/g.17724 Transcript_11590/m.17724 type:complete len:395 (-) Transcript_11590:931-2115(-)|eukprot:CAMPEP_0201733488 /NCGR_PEP_ID=MMETSP0593-20130828/31731_1 /ASSEMBLY_ACC=CAM_ASM_000672 /TAXON_ID=267983 /ORGANISM="Skeletonema japonicum, Strain CCMP2506" /LENGTH=394 /DNA_ID=CAMNT_0048226649 /DNA_START=106 /DNA_END=1290 /DNA_ORIENTATION=+
MISNQAAPVLYHGVGDEDNLTVHVSDANSLLGTHLLEGDWADALDYLDTPEGEQDAYAKNDPLGLFNVGNKKLTVPKSKSGALFASLYVRAPFPLIQKICNISNDAEVCDLMYTLSVIPHEEQHRLEGTQQRKIPYRSRSWTSDEYNRILNLFLKECMKGYEAGRSASPLLEKCPSWIIPSAFVLTPLVMAAYNPDVPSTILQILCMLEPKAIGMDCKLFTVSTIPLIVAAASPVPPVTCPIDVRDEVKRNRWDKVKLLMNKDWFEQYTVQSISVNEVIGAALPSPPAIVLEQMKVACDEAMKRKEWELVRELLKQFDSMTGEELLTMGPIQTALAQHDRKVSTQLRKLEQKRSRDEWLHRNMGLVMYPVNILVDLIYTVIPQKHDVSLVSPMS